MNQRTTATQQWRIHNRGQGAMVQMTILGTPLQHCAISVPEWVTSSCCRHYVIALDEYACARDLSGCCMRPWTEPAVHALQRTDNINNGCRLCSQSVIARPENIRSRDTATSRCSSRRRRRRAQSHALPQSHFWRDWRDCRVILAVRTICSRFAHAVVDSW